jgi:hypothetical protein
LLTQEVSNTLKEAQVGTGRNSGVPAFVILVSIISEAEIEIVASNYGVGLVLEVTIRFIEVGHES